MQSRAIRVSLHSDSLRMGLDGPEIKFREIKGLLIPIGDEIDAGILDFGNALMVPSLRVEYVSHGVISTPVVQMVLPTNAEFHNVPES